MNKLKKLQILNAWRNTIDNIKIRKAQRKTAYYIYKQRYQKYSFFALSYYVKFRQNLRLQLRKSKLHNISRLQKKGINSLYIYQVVSKQKREINRIALNMKAFYIKKYALANLKSFQSTSTQYKMLKSCAHTYYNISMMRLGFQSMKKYRLISQGFTEQTNFLKEYNDKKLKSKLITFLKKSNEEFNNEADNVIVYKARQYIRKLFDSLALNWVKNKSHPQPKDNSFFYMLYMWTKNSKENSSSYKFPQSIQVSPNQAYINKNNKVIGGLQQYALIKVFKVWKDSYLKIKAFIESRNSKMLFNIIRKLRVRSNERAKYRFMLQKLRSRRNTKLQQKAFKNIFLNLRQSVKERIINEKYGEYRQMTSLKQSYDQWRSLYLKISTRESQKQTAHQIKQTKLRKTYFDKWQRSFLIHHKKTYIKEQGLQFQRERVFKKYFQFWQQKAHHYLKLEKEEQYYANKNRNILMKKALESLLLNILTNRKQQCCKEIVNEKRGINLIAKAYNAWTLALPELRKKNQLYKYLQRDRNTSLQKNILKSLRLYSEFRSNKKTTDYIMTRSIQAIAMRKYLKLWHNSLIFKTGLQLIDLILLKSKMREFYCRVNKKAKFEDNVAIHLKMFNQYKLLEYSYNSLKYNAQRNAQFEQSTQLVHQNERVHNIKIHLMEWKRLNDKREKEIKMFYFSLIQIKNIILKQYFEPLKQNYKMKSLIKTKLLQSRINKKQMIFNNFTRILLSRVNCNKQKIVVEQQVRRKYLISTLLKWIHEIRDISTVRDCKLYKQSQLKSMIINSWKEQVEINSNNKQLIKKGHFISRKCILRNGIKGIKQYTEFSLQQKDQIRNVKQLCLKNICSKGFKYMKLFYEMKQLEYQKINNLTNKRNLKEKNKVLREWLKLSEPRIIKLNVLNYLSNMQKTYQTRISFGKWIGYTQYSQHIDEIAEDYNSNRVKEDKSYYFKRLRASKERRQMSRQRINAIADYCEKKNKLRYLTYLRYGTRIALDRKAKNILAMRQVQNKMMQKGLYSLLYIAKKNNQYRYINNELKSSALQRIGPIIILGFRKNVALKKEYRIKQIFAGDFYKEKLNLKSFKSLFLNMITKLESKGIKKKAIVHFCESLMRMAFYQMQLYYCSSKIINGKRKILANKVRKVDYSSSLLRTFSALKQYFLEEKEQAFIRKGSLAFNKQARVFEQLKQQWQKAHNLKSISKQVQTKHQQLKTKKILVQWMKALDNESKIKIVQRLCNQYSKFKAFDTLLYRVYIKRCISNCSQQRISQSKNICLRALLNNYLTQKRNRHILSTQKIKSLERSQKMAFLGLKYETQLSRNLHLFQTRRSSQQLTKGYNGWKYIIMIDKLSRQFTQMRQKKQITLPFYHWMHQALSINTKRNVLNSLIQRKDSKDKLSSFKTWKKFSFGAVFIETLQLNLTLPYQQYIAQRCIQAWRRYARLQQNKEYIFDQMRSVSTTLETKRVFREWYEASLTQMPGRILAKRLEACTNRFNKHNALVVLRKFSHNQKITQLNQEILTSYLTSNTLRRFFNTWRKTFAVQQLQQIVQIKRDISLKRKCLQAMQINVVEKQQENESIAQIQNHLQNCSLQTQQILQKGLKIKGKALDRSQLIQYCFNNWKLGMNKLRHINQIKQQSQTVQQQNILAKYFYKIVDTFNANQQQQEQENEAVTFNMLSLQRKMYNVFVINLLKQRKHKNAQMFYNYKIMKKLLDFLRYNFLQNKNNSNLNTRMMYFLKRKCIYLFRASFSQWRVRYQQRQYHSQAIQEYQKYRNKRIIQACFDYLATVTQQQLEIKDLTTKASIYFEKKNALRTYQTVFNAMKQYAFKQQKVKKVVEDKEFGALKFYAYNLMIRFIRSWRKEVAQNKQRQRRSRMYALFSAWKFYTKERSLLKKYLQECNVMNPQLLSTMEMRENAAQQYSSKSKQSKFGGSLTSGTPFMSCERVLTPNGFLMNSASPYNYYNQN